MGQNFSVKAFFLFIHNILHVKPTPFETVW